MNWTLLGFFTAVGLEWQGLLKMTKLKLYL